MKFVSWAFRLGVIVLIAALAWGQTSTTSVRGTISDANGAVIPGAQISVANPATGFSRSGVTDGQGAYQFVSLPPGTYELSVTSPGFAKVKRAVQLLVDVPTTVNLTLSIATTETVIDVGGQAPTVNTQDASIGNAFETARVEALPFEGRDPVGILSLQPGVAFVGDATDENFDSRNGSVSGARSDQTNVTLDGVDNNDQSSGFAFRGALRAPLDSLQEFRVTTTGANADSGRSSGGQVTLVTRSGTNAIHGALYEYHRPTLTTANDWFNKKSQLDSGLQNRPPKLIRNTFGARLGGPIKKDRLFYFFNYEGQRTRENQMVTRVVPSETMRRGIIMYRTCGTPGDTTCDPAAADPNPVQLSAANITAMDPLGIGPSPAVMAVLNQYPVANTDAVGDTMNFRGYTFSAPSPNKLDTYVGKLDYNLTPTGMHRIWVRGNLQNDNAAGVPQWVYPDGKATPPTTVTHTNNKGIAAGYTATFGANWVNNLRYGFIRPGVARSGAGQGHYVAFRGLDNLESTTRNTIVHAPVHNFVNDTTWLRGTHTIQFGGNLRLLNIQRQNDLNSWFSATSNPSWLYQAGIANTGQGLDPAAADHPEVADFFKNSYNFPMGALVGLVAEVNAQYNRDKTGTALPEGTYVKRKYKSYELEFYTQDAWRATPNLIITAGLRYTLLQPPYEATGLQVQPTNDMGNWYRQRWMNMAGGTSFKDPITFDLSGQANGKKPYWGWDYLNLAPRLAIAYSPNFDSGFMNKLFGTAGKSSIRLGYGMYYDHFGEGIVNTFDQFGSFGLSAALTNPPNQLTTAEVPRFTGLHDIPQALVKPAPPGGFPVTYPDTFAITWGLDDHLKTPYAHVFDLSITRELPKNFVVEVAYVGRLARRLLQQDDLAMPLNLSDPKSKTTYFQAAQALARMASAGTDISQVAPIPYWENMFPAAAGAAADMTFGCAPGSAPATVTATQAIYDLFACVPGNETAALQLMDQKGIIYANDCFPACSINGEYSYFDPQFSSLFAWRSIGTSTYHSMMLSLRRRMAQGLQFDLNYTFSKSIDMGSDTERITEWGGPQGQIINSWFPNQNKALSDFDARHQLNANWAYELPFGRGKSFGSGWNSVANAFFGGWSLSGLMRWANSYPFSVANGAMWSTNWQLSGNAIVIDKKPKTGTFMINGEPNTFADPQTAIKAFRMAMPGEAGQRNNLAGPGFFNIDTGVGKSWKIREGHQLKFRWETFNLTNSVRFDALNVQSSLDSSDSFGKYNQTMTKKRVMQFALRYEF